MSADRHHQYYGKVLLQDPNVTGSQVLLYSSFPWRAHVQFTSMYCRGHGNPVTRLAACPRALAKQPWVSRTNAYTHLCAAARWSHRISMTRLCTARLHATFCTRRGRRPRSIDWISMSATALGTACAVLPNEIQSRHSRLRLAPFFPARCSLILGCATPGAYLSCASGFH